MAQKTKRPIHTVVREEIVEIWLGPPRNPEAELICSINRFWVSALIAALRNIK